MKKITLLLLAVIFSLSSTHVLALDLDKLANAVGGGSSKEDTKNPQKKSGFEDQLFGKVEEKVEKITDRLESRLDKYEKKFDEYEEKIDKAEKATDRIVATINSLDSSKLHEYAKYAKIAAIAVTSVFGLLLLLLILVSVQLMKANCRLKKMNH